MTAATQDVNVEAPNQNTDEIVRTLVDNMTAAEIRAWMSTNDISRSRGARKQESVLQALEQDPDLVTEKYDEVRFDRFTVSCGCGMDDGHDSLHGAARAVRTHKSENHTHFPKAVDNVNEERIYG